MTAIRGWFWWCRPSHNGEIQSIKDLAGKKVGVSAPGSSTDFFLKYLLKKNGLDPTSASVIGVGLGATAVAAMEQGQIDAACDAGSVGHRPAGQPIRTSAFSAIRAPRRYA